MSPYSAQRRIEKGPGVPITIAPHGLALFRQYERSRPTFGWVGLALAALMYLLLWECG